LTLDDLIHDDNETFLRLGDPAPAENLIHAGRENLQGP